MKLSYRSGTERRALS